MVRIEKQPLMVRVLSTSDSMENRAQRRKKYRTSPSISTKPWTLGRIIEYRNYLQKALKGAPKGDTMIQKTFSALNRKINMIKATRKRLAR